MPQPQQNLDPAADDTYRRLLDAAGEIFAEAGFHRATIREICARASANIAAVNYHFGDKENLYLAVLRYAHGCAMAKYPHDMGLAADASPEQKLRAFVWSFLMRILDQGRPAWHGKLMIREMSEPTRAMDVLVEEHIRPSFLFISSTMCQLLAEAANESRIRMCVSSLVGQCLFYQFGRAVTERLYTGLAVGPQMVDELTDHIVAGTLAGISALRDPRRLRDPGAKEGSP